MPPSSPIKLPRPTYAAHSRKEVQAFVVPHYEYEITIDEFWKELCCDPKDYKQGIIRGYQPKDDFQEYMNGISKTIYDGRENASAHPIEFHNTSNNPPLYHPTSTGCKPDLAACPRTKGAIHWTEIEATIEIHSSGATAKEGPRQAASYTLYLLQARPDRISVQGFYADAKGIILIISSAEGIKKSPKLKLSEASDVQLIYAFVGRLYDPHSSMLDPTITRRKDPESGRWVFDIMLTIPTTPSFTIPNAPSSVKHKCPGYMVSSAGRSVGQRTHVFANNDHPALFNGVPIPVIKEQYRRQDHRFDEPEIINHIHKEGNVPGVVRASHWERVLHADGSGVRSGDRYKERSCLLEYGRPFMNLKTPLEALISIYDLLETTRFMYNKRNVLHRDISEGNVMHLDHAVAPEDVELDTSAGEVMHQDLSVASLPPNEADEANKSPPQYKFCTINHLLDPKVDPSATLNLLIDFDRGEILTAKLEERRLERTGTPIFMARAVRAGQPLGEVGDVILFKKMPELSDMARLAYEKLFSDRLSRFQSSSETYLVEIKSNVDPSSFRHALRHDAESAFWLLVWWAVSASPECHTVTQIPNALWSSLVDTDYDNRNCKLLDGSLDPEYSPLYLLLNTLGRAVMYDLHWATEEPYSHPEFLHEAFQRHILNFIFANRGEAFMALAKSDVWRKPKRVTENPSISTSQLSAPSFRHSSGSSGKRSRPFESESGSSKKLRGDNK